MSEVKVIVTVIRKWYAKFCHPKIHPYTKFGILTSKNIEYAQDMKRGGRTDSASYYVPPKVPLGHKNRKAKLTYIYIEKDIKMIQNKSWLIVKNCLF